MKGYDLVGQHFGRLVVKKLYKKDKNNHIKIL